MYITTFEGDISDIPYQAHHSLDDALNALACLFKQPRKWAVEPDEHGFCWLPDPEDDRILIWKANPPNMRIVWHFTGWHYPWPNSNGTLFDYDYVENNTAESMNAGCLLGFDKPLYTMAMDEC